MPGTARVLFASHTCYFDNSNGASVASRALMECLARHGATAEALSGTALESGRDEDFLGLMTDRGLAIEAGRDFFDRTTYHANEEGVAVTLHGCPTGRLHVPDVAECGSFLGLFHETMDRLRPDVVVNFGGDALANELRRAAKAKGASVVFALHNFNYTSADLFEGTDAVLVPSRFAASFYRKDLGLECTPIPYLVDFRRARVEDRTGTYVTFVNPSHEKGVYAFARIADELGHRRPDISLLVVEGRGTERTLADCGLNLARLGNVSIMSHTTDPREFWSVTRLCVMPSLWWESQGLVAVEAMLNGIPVIASDRGALPETLGDAGIILGLPRSLNPSTRELPTAAEVESWVRVIIALWDDTDWYAEQSRKAIAESRRWSPEVLEPRYVRFFAELGCSKRHRPG